MGSQGASVSSGSSESSETYCLKFNDFHANLTTAFNELLEESDLLDATIVLDNGRQVLRAHKLVLSASSAVFRSLFRNTNAVLKSSNEPCIFMLDVKAEDFKSLLNFMYEGQVNVAHDNLNDFLALAEKLQVRGLTNASNNNLRTAKRLQMENHQETSTANAASKRPRMAPHQQHSETTLNIKEEHNESLFHATSNNPIVPSAYPQFSQQFAYENNELQENGDSTATSSNQAFAAAAAQAPAQQQTANPAQIIGGPGEDFSINPQTLVDHKGVVVITAGGHLSSTTPPGLIIPQSVVGNSVQAALPAAPQATTVSSSASSTASKASSSAVILGNGSRSSSSSNSNSSSTAATAPTQNNGGTCMHCHKTFRQLRSHIQDVHCPTPTPCPLCGKMFSSKHKMFGHKYRSCPNRTRNLVRHLQDLDQQHEPSDNEHHF